MNTSSSRIGRDSEIAYDNHLVVISFLDESDAFTVTGSPARSGNGSRDVTSSFRRAFSDAGRDFTTSCCENRARLTKLWKSYAQANGMDADRTPLAPYLYNPVCYLTFGDADNVAVVLVDDFDSMVRVTMEVGSPVEHVSLAFVPQIDSLGLPEEQIRLFTDFPSLLAPKGEDVRKPELQGDRDGRKMYRPASHRFQEEAPLMALVEFRVGGLASLGSGLALQRALFRAMVAKVHSVVAKLRGHAASDGHLIRPADLEPATLKFVLLDPQGPSDVTLFVACSNYSVAMVVVTELRRMTLSDLMEDDSRVEAHLRRSGGHQQLFLLGKELGWSEGSDSESMKCFPHNHVFLRTHTTLGVSDRAFAKPEEYTSRIGGYVVSNVRLGVNCGHLDEAEAGMKDAVAPIEGNAEEGKQQESIPDNLYVQSRHFPYRDIHRLAVGYDDLQMDLPPQVETPESGILATPTSVFLRSVKILLERFGIEAERAIDTPPSPPSGDAGPACARETGLLDVSNWLTVPTPRLERDGKPVAPEPMQESHAPFMAILLQLRDRAFSRRTGIFDPKELAETMQLLGIPKTLRRTISYLYQDFAMCLGDPHLFCGALDLYDTYATLYTMLTETWPDELRKARPEKRLFLFDEQKIDEIEVHANAIRNAIMHRLAATRLHAEVRDMSVDFRGGLTRLVAAAEVFLKCGLGLVKRLTPSIEQSSRPYRDLGGVTNLSLQPRTYSLQVSRADPRAKSEGAGGFPRLMHILIDAGHIFSPVEFVGYIHEAAHLLWDITGEERDVYPTRTGRDTAALPTRTATDGSDSPDNDVQAMTVRIEEVFAEYLTHLLVFKSDVELFSRYYAATYSVHPSSNTNRLDHTAVLFVEIMLRLFLITDPILRMRQKEGDRPLSWNPGNPYENEFQGDSVSTQFTADASDRFMELMRCYARYFSQYNRIRKEFPEFEEYCQGQFEAIFPHAFPLAIKKFDKALRYYREFMSKPALSSGGPDSDNWKDFLAATEAGFEEGTPNIAQRYRAAYCKRHHLDENEAIPKDDAEVDDLLLVCELLNRYLQFCFTPVDENKRFHLYRKYEGDNPTGEASYPDDKGPWHVFQLDTASGGLRCADPQMRRERLRREVAIMKTLWGISTKLGSRRLAEIITQSTDRDHS